MSKIQKMPNGCWMWTGCTSKAKTPYGIISLGSKKLGTDYVHRVSYKLFNGNIPDKLEIRHTCHNSLCINPEHLIVGTKKDNQIDKIKADRHCKFLKGNEELAPIIMDLYERGMKVTHIAGELNMQYQTVSKIINTVKNRKKMGKNPFARV